MTAAMIFGCAGHRLSADERSFFRDVDPLGFILFARNVATPAQLRALTSDLRDSVGRADAPVLIDQEGGRVARLKPPYWRVAPPAAVFGELYAREPETAVEAARLNARLIAADLTPLGIDVDCAPVLDVTVPGAHGVIGDRAFGVDPATVAALGRAQADGLLLGGVMPVMKHIPGHGRARADSHLELPVVEATRGELEASDFAPFRALADLPWAMTAHVLYRALSGNRPATTSDVVVRDIIRGHIGFDGLLLTDDLSMGALDGTCAERAAASLAAGCDVV
ncbi:MAG: beta-N-acetylhexosaminidase, partial [Alphaproteobacteria bacterium]|nr:beta-N-acetylhexosaminidase [Alphaproteobacteria bacterium]